MGPAPNGIRAHFAKDISPKTTQDNYPTKKEAHKRHPVPYIMAKQYAILYKGQERAVLSGPSLIKMRLTQLFREQVKPATLELNESV